MSANHLASSASSATRTCTSPASTPAQECGPGKKREGETEKIRTKGQEVHREGSGGGGGVQRHTTMALVASPRRRSRRESMRKASAAPKRIAPSSSFTTVAALCRGSHIRGLRDKQSH